MSDTATISRSGPFWEFLAGRQPAPPAAVTLGWELSWVAPERGEIEVFFNGRADGRITGTGRVVHRGGSIAFLAGRTA